MDPAVDDNGFEIVPPQKQPKAKTQALPVASDGGFEVVPPAAGVQNPGFTPTDMVKAGGESLASQVGHGALDLYTGASKGLLNTAIAGPSRLIHSLPMVGPKIIPDQGLNALEQSLEPHGTMENIGHVAEQGAEFLTPMGEAGAAEKAATMFPKMARFARPAARIATNALGTGALNKLQGGDFSTGAGAGLVGGTIGEGVHALAPSMAESALRVRKSDRMYGKRPGEAILNETKGIRPASIATQADTKLTDLTNELNTSARNAPVRATLKPAQDALMDAIDEAKNRNSFPMVRRLQTVEKQLSTDIRSGLPLAQTQRAAKVLEMKRGIGELVKSWPREEQIGIDPILKKVYNALDSEVDRAVPGSSMLNSRMSSLIPVAKRGESVSRNADISQRMLNRAAAHTGALAGTLAGGYQGYQHGGAPGALFGAGMGLVVPEAIASPTGQMFMARRMASPRFGTLTKGLSLQIARPDEDQRRERK